MSRSPLRTTIKIAAILLAAVIVYQIGYHRCWRDDNAYPQQPTQYWKDLVELDKQLLAKAERRTNSMQSGLHVFEVHLPDKPPQTKTVELSVSNGRLIGAPDLKSPMQKASLHIEHQEAGILSWSSSDAEEGPASIYVGMIDGDRIEGRVYVQPTPLDEWRPNPPGVGFWRLSPKDGGTDKLSSSAKGKEKGD